MTDSSSRIETTGPDGTATLHIDPDSSYTIQISEDDHNPVTLYDVMDGMDLTIGLSRE